MSSTDSGVVDWPPSRRPRRHVGRWVVFGILAVLFFGGNTLLSYYVDVLWFDSLGYLDVFWRTVNLQATTFAFFGAATFLILYGTYFATKPPRLGELTKVPILINGQPIKLPVEPVFRLAATVGALVIGAITGAGLMAEWPTIGLYWYGRGAAAQTATAQTLVDPIFGRPLTFYLFTLPAWQLVSGWLLTMGIFASAIAGFFVVVTSGSRLLTHPREGEAAGAWRGLSIGLAVVLLMLAVRVYLGRFEQIFDDRGGGTFTGIDYTDAHVTLTGMLVVAGALVLGSIISLINAVAAPKLRWLVAAIVPAGVCYVAVGIIGWYVTSFVVKPNELVRETPYIAHNIEFTRRAFALDRLTERAFPADSGIDALDPNTNKTTLQNIRLWDWRALQDTLRQIQEIRTYYDFPDIDIDRYVIDGSVRQMMVAARELNIEKLPASSRNWINEKLIYTHGYGMTMNPVNGFTPEGLPSLVLSNMPVQSTIPSLMVSRPEIYFGQLTNTDVYVKTRQKEFNYPQGETNNLTSYEGNGGVVLGGLLRRSLIALERGDISKVPFSDDIGRESRLMMRRNIRERLETLAPFLSFDPDPYIVVGADGRLSWIVDGYTKSDSYPYARHYTIDQQSVNYMRNSVKAVVDAYDGSTSLFVFDKDDPVIAAYRGLFPALFKDADTMPAGLRAHVRYPELMLKVQASVYGLYHMTAPGVFYNREDLWSVASEVGMNGQREQATLSMEPNFVLMTLPGETATEFVEILPFTPANRNNLIGWIAGRSDGAAYGTAIVYDFPKTKLVDGPLQVEARIDQNAQLSGQLSLWNQQGSHVRRGTLLVIPVGRALLYAEAIYLQAERSPMPELRLVVLALQDRLAYAPTFEGALASLFGNAPSSLSTLSTAGNTAAPNAPAARATGGANTAAPGAPTGTRDVNGLITDAARNLADYQRLTAEGKLGEAGQKLEALKHALDELASRGGAGR